MMKNHFKFLFFVILFFLLVGIVFTPVYALPDRQKRVVTTENASSTDASGNNFCNRLDDLLSMTDQKLDKAEKWLEEKRADRLNNLAKRRMNRDERLNQFRDNWDGNRTKIYERLEAMASTTEQKDAVIAFKTAIDEAAATKQTAIDTAIKTYRDGLDMLFTERKEAVDKAKADHRAAIESIFQKADTDCASGLDASIIRVQVKKDLALERDAYRSDAVTIEKSADKAKDLAAIRQDAIKKAVDDFKQALDGARNGLKAVFGNE